MRKINLLIILIALIFTTVPPKSVKAASLVVTKTADTDDGICDTDCSLREAVAVAANKDVITFAPSLSGQTIFLNSRIEIKKGITINGSGLAPRIKIDGSLGTYLFIIPFCPECTDSVAGEPVKFISLDMQNSNDDVPTLINYRNTQVINVNFNGNTNTDSRGGAILNQSGTMIILNSIFTNNQSLNDEGGAIFNRRNMVIESSVFLNNYADTSGGAIYNEGELDIYDTLFEGNSAADDGGAIFTRFGITGAYVNVVRSTFYNNNADGGGGIYSTQDAILDVSNSTFYMNIATGAGGGIFHDGEALEIINSTFNNNQSSNTSGTVHAKGDMFDPIEFSIVNTIVANSTGGVDCYIQDTIVLENTNNIIENNGAGINSCGAPFSTVDPMLAPLADNGGLTPTHFLLPGSPAINTGNNSKCSASPINNTSQNGIPRPVGGTCDIGAVEMPVITTPNIVSIARLNINPTNASSINYQVTFSESVTGVDISAFSLITSGVTGASVNSVNGSGNNYTVAVNAGSGDGTIRLDVIDDDTILSNLNMPLGGTGAGNGNFTIGEVYTIDKTAPTVTTINGVGASPSKMLNVSYLVTFSENVTGVDISDFTLHTTGVVGAFVSNVSGSGNTRVVSVNTGQGSIGTIRLDFIDDDTVIDLAGNLITSGHIGDETYTIQKAILSAPVLRSPRSTARLNDTTPNLVWQKVAKAQNYEIQIADSNDFSNVINTANNSTATTYTPSPLADDTYYWRVRAIDVSGGVGKWSQTRIFTIDTVGPAAPILISPSGMLSTRTNTFRWNKVSDAIQYRLLINKNDDDFSSPDYTFTLRTLTRRITLPVGEYYWCVQARDAVGNWGACSTANDFKIQLP